MYKLNVKLLHPEAKAPTVAHPCEDLGYDIYALEDTTLFTGIVNKVRTGIAVEAFFEVEWKVEYYPAMLPYTPMGLIIKDRSSMAARGVLTHGGVIDAGYRGEVCVLMSVAGQGCYTVHKGEKIAQMVPVAVCTGKIEVVDELTEASRGANGFGSSGS